MGDERDKEILTRLNGISSDIDRVSSEIGSVSRKLEEETGERRNSFRWTVGLIIALAALFATVVMPLFLNPIFNVIDDVDGLRGSVELLSNNIGQIKGMVDGMSCP